MNEKDAEVGFIKYEGDAVLPGILDAGKAGLALIGLDELLRYFNAKQAADLAKADYEVPIQVRAGSWEAVIILGASAFALAYLSRAGNEMAKSDFEGIGLKDVFKKSLKAAIYFIRLAKHTTKLKGWLLENVKWRNDNTEVGIPNKDGAYEYFPVEFVKWYATVPPQIIKKMAEVVERERSLTVGVFDGEIVVQETITIREKQIFVMVTDEESDDEFLFPELEQGMNVKLEGRLTRGNAETNSLGLDYRGHILNCVPDAGSVVQYKPALFLRCIVEGTVTRLNRTHVVGERKPTIVFTRITPLEKTPRLFFCDLKVLRRMVMTETVNSEVQHGHEVDQRAYL